jgi:hypothetical protein
VSGPPVRGRRSSGLLRDLPRSPSPLRRGPKIVNRHGRCVLSPGERRWISCRRPIGRSWPC